MQFSLLSLRTHSALTISLIPFVFTSMRKRVASLDGWARFAKPLRQFISQSAALAEPGAPLENYLLNYEIALAVPGATPWHGCATL